MRYGIVQYLVETIAPEQILKSKMHTVPPIMPRICRYVYLLLTRIVATQIAVY